MPQATHELRAIYIDGETKTGKGSASQAIAAFLENRGLHVYYDVAGDFYRRYTAMVRRELALSETDALPTDDSLQRTVTALYDSGRAFERDDSLGDLQRPAISKSVSTMAELAIAQQAGSEWWQMTLKQAMQVGAELMVLDGRNPRSRVRDASDATGIKAATVLDLYMLCEPIEAARRALLGAGVTHPTTEQLEIERVHVADRRDRDRHRAEQPFIVPSSSLPFDPTAMTPAEAVQASWQIQDAAMLPLTITLDNTHITKPDMLAAVTGLAAEAVEYPLP